MGTAIAYNARTKCARFTEFRGNARWRGIRQIVAPESTASVRRPLGFFSFIAVSDSAVARLAKRRARRQLSQLLPTEKWPDPGVAAVMPRLEPKQCSDLVPLRPLQPLMGLTDLQERYAACDGAALLRAQRVTSAAALRPEAQKCPVDLVTQFDGQFLEVANAVELGQLAPDRGPAFARASGPSPPTIHSVEQILCGRVGERAYHGVCYNGWRLVCLAAMLVAISRPSSAAKDSNKSARVARRIKSDPFAAAAQLGQPTRDARLAHSG